MAPAPMSNGSNPGEPRAPLARHWLLLLGWWAALRFVFFHGFINSDDYYHIRFAVFWDAAPASHIETRLLFNALLRGATSMFGLHEWVWTLPALAGSLLLLIATYLCARRLFDARTALLAGLVCASFPIDVVFATIPTAASLSAGLAALSFALLLYPSLPRASVLAGVAGAVALLAHPITLFFVSAAAAGQFLTGEKRRAAIYWALSVGGYFLLDAAFSAWVAGDPFHNLSILRAWHDPDAQVELYSPAWFLFPVQTFFFSKDFGFAPVLAVGLAFSPLARGRPLVRTLALTIALLWLWLGYGTAKPTTYEPFWRLTRFAYPLVLPLSLALASAFAALPRRAPALAAALCGLHVALLAGSGSFGQSVEITRRMAPFVNAHPHAHFLAGGLTLRELTVLNGFQPPPNVYDAGNPPPSADPAAQWFYLDNPLNAPAPKPNRPRPAATALPAPAGPAALVTKAEPRLLFTLAPERLLSRYPALLRRPAGRIVPITPP
jgi:hypothetical protein